MSTSTPQNLTFTLNPCTLIITATLASAAVLGMGFSIGWSVRPINTDCLTTNDILEAQRAWGKAVVAIGDAWMQGQNCDAALEQAKGAFDAAYTTPLLFKPTVTYEPYTFRNNRTDTVSYFVGKCAIPDRVGEDLGFALGFVAGDSNNSLTWKGYSNFYFHDFKYLINDNYCHSAVAQGKVTLTSRLTGSNSTVDKTFVYTPASSGLRARISVHHSSDEVPPPKDAPAFWATQLLKEKN